MRALLLALALLAPALAGCVGADDETGPVAAFTVEETADGFRFDGTSSKGEGLMFAWDLGDGGTHERDVFEYAYGFANGRVVVQLTVTDLHGRSDTAARDVVVGTGRNAVPTAALEPAKAEAHVGEPVRFDAGASGDPDGDPLTFSWGYVLGAGSASAPRIQELPVGAAESLTFQARGLHRYHLHEHAEAEVSITVADGAPEQATVEVFETRFDPADVRVAPGGAVEFVNRAEAARSLMRLEYVPALTPLPGEGAGIEVAFDAPGEYEVLVTAKDPLGATATGKATVTVRPKPIVLEERFTGTVQPGGTSKEHALEAPAPGVLRANLTARTDVPAPPEVTLTVLADGQAIGQAGPGSAFQMEVDVPAGTLTLRVDAEPGTVLADYAIDVRAVLQP